MHSKTHTWIHNKYPCVCNAINPFKLLSQLHFACQFFEWIQVHPFLGGREEAMKRLRGGEDRRGRSQKTLTPKATPCLQHTVMQQGLGETATAHRVGQTHGKLCPLSQMPVSQV